ncbi:hypothetical protein BGW36DRAFT_299248 [Talaromyces proteolyticus]|uniref:Uncharacterized protein n=1 Tax=Talaromyces proteolyticus TaxID=1131652 RepID=A0AAD4KNC1_9EURO|nr:uncharacterized protein BGW36DRAFT_299248 [Talaromyces proteolyticus]KAH8695506.1 hypothetical protein BGW36DRAFT_299248 [Talaromyces proteolyticus]
MGPVLYNHFSEGPTMVLPHSQNHPSFQFPCHSTQGLQAFDSSSWSMDAPYASSSKPQARFSTSWTPAPAAKPIFMKTSRKRSRDDSEEPNEQRKEAFNPAPKFRAPVMEEPIYGEGMVLLNPRTGMALSAESQTGTWYEENVEKQVAVAPPISSRRQTQDASSSALLSRKSQRLDISAPGLDDVSLACIQQRLQSNTSDDDRRALGNTGAFNEPHIDDVTLLLGISWQRVNRDDLAPAICGWERYINNHFHRYLHDARILLKSRSLNAYLVAAIPAIDIAPANTGFGDLTEAQLVGSTVDNCLQNLRATPIQFEGSEVLRASERSPERVINNTNGFVAPISKDDFNNIPTHNSALKDEVVMGTGMDLDM